MKRTMLVTVYPLAGKFSGGADSTEKFEAFRDCGLHISKLENGDYLLTRMVIGGSRRFSRRFTKDEIFGKAIFIEHRQTGQSLRLDQILSGEKFTEFDPVKLFGTNKPAGEKVVAWLKSLWGTGEVYSAMEWVKNSMPLDVLLGFGGPLPGVTSDPETGWHWSCSMNFYKVKFHQ